MLEQNRVWLQQANPALLKGYKEQTPREAKETVPLRCIRMSHQESNSNLPPSYISPVFYQKQQELTKALEDTQPEGPVQFCVVGGTDGGLLLNDVVERNNIKHLAIIETDMDSFRHSLTVTDWPSLFQEFEAKGGTIYLHIGEVTLEVKQRIAKHLSEIGIWNAANIHVAHDDTDLGKGGVVQVIKCLQDCINSLGFYDDERIGLAHTVHKLEQGARFLRAQVIPWIEKPAMVCGNGPSLKKMLPHIKRHRAHMILIACGTSIGVFCEEGVTPDFYIEQERPKKTGGFTRDHTTQEFRNGITAIGLNVVHPQTHDIFPDIAYALKANDFGAIVGRQYLDGAPQLMFVNPMVVNCGLSVACALGFKHIYLAGADCAFAKDGSSHTGKTNHGDYSNKVKVRGNFREEVTTTPIYNNSRIALELCIRSNPKVTFYNLGDGAYVAGARPTQKFKPRGAKPISKTQIMAPFKPALTNPDKDEMRRGFTLSMFGLRQVIDSTPAKVKSRSEAFFFIEAIYGHLAKLKQTSPLFWYLVKGTMTTQLVFLSTLADADLKSFDKGTANLKELAGLIHGEMKDSLFRFDDWE